MHKPDTLVVGTIFLAFWGVVGTFSDPPYPKTFIGIGTVLLIIWECTT